MRKIFLFLFACMLASAANAQIYVTETSSGNQTGTSWADAHTDLQTAIYEASAGDTIWVAQGVYKPLIDTMGNIPPVPTSRSFWLKNGVVIYGGFNGTETSLSQRDPVNLKATMEGEITTGVFAEHVLNVYNFIDSTAILDGFIVQNGKSTDTSAEKNGSGMILRGSAGFYNIVFKDNDSYNQGGAIYAENSSSLFVRCRFQSNNVLSYDGGACNFVYSDIEMYNCIFDGNQAGRFGGAITTVESNLLVQNGTFFANTAGTNIFQFSSSGIIDLKNCIFHSNSAPVAVGTSGASVYFLDGLMPQDNNWLILCPTCIAGTPNYTNIGAGDYSLVAGSPGIDETLTFTPVNDHDDYAGNPRLSGTSMDMGAFEYQSAVGISPATVTPRASLFPNPCADMVTIQATGTLESVVICNMAGQVVQTENSPRFSVAGLAAGLYYVQIRTSAAMDFVRFVKE
jgi:predicted outer membrane repeat protein